MMVKVSMKSMSLACATVYSQPVFSLSHSSVKSVFMQIETAFYQSKIKECLSLRQRDNSNYSLRAYARDLGVHPGTLAKVIKGERALPIKSSQIVINKLKLSPKDRTLFMESLLRRKTNIDNIKIDPLDTRYIVDDSNYKVIAEWEHFVVTDLFDLPDFKATTEDIAQRLSLTLTRAEVVVENLIVSGLLQKDENGKLKRVHSAVKTTEDIKSQALEEAHEETLKLGINKLKDIEVELRDFSSSAMAIDLDQLLEAKTIIREFRQKMAALLRDGRNKTDIYQLAIQFYPLTNLKKSSE
jgi:uncharacterized protein (TIGR02147 family)